MVTDVYPKEKVATAQGIISGMVAVGTILGLVVGAYIVQDLGWQDAFHTAFILSILLIIAVAIVLKKDMIGQKTKMDYAGTVLLMTGITLVLVYLTEGPSLGWAALENIAFLIPGLILIIFFFVFESGRTNPLIELKLLRIRNVFLANMVGIVSGVVMFLAFFAVVYYAQLPAPYGLGLDTISTGMALAPAALAMMVVGPIVGKVMPKLGPKPVILFGSVVMMLGFGMFIMNRSTSLDLTIDSAVSFIGVIAMIIPIVNMITVSIPQDSTSVGLGMNSMLRNLGGAIGPVLATTIMTSFTVAVIVIEGGKPVVVGTLPSSTAFDTIFEMGIILLVAVFIMSLFIKNYVFGKAEP
jgi:MFS family permease